MLLFVSTRTTWRTILSIFVSTNRSSPLLCMLAEDRVCVSSVVGFLKDTVSPSVLDIHAVCFIQGVQKVTKPIAYLESVFPVRLISKRLWPPRSPDLIPRDFLLWGHLKDTVYSNHPHTHCKSFRPTFSALWTAYQLAHCKKCSLTWFVLRISVKSVMVDIFSAYYKK
jgi:hypothetical protein